MDIEKRPPSIEGKLKKEFLRYDNEKKQRTLKDTLKDLGETSSLHGISKIASSRQVVVKVLWCILFLGTFAVFIIQLWQLFKTFYSYPVQTTVSLEFNSIAFPAITICNMNPVKNGKLHMEPAIEEALRKGQSPNALLRKRREATKKRTPNDPLKYFSTSSSPKAQKNDVKGFPQDQGPFQSHLEEVKSKTQTQNEHFPFNEHVLSPEMISLAKKGMRRRKREVSVTNTLEYVSSTPASTYEPWNESTQTVSSAWLDETIRPTSDSAWITPSTESVATESTASKSLHSQLYTNSVLQESTNHGYISPSTSIWPTPTQNFEDIFDSFSLSNSVFRSEMEAQSSTWQAISSEYPDNSTYPDDFNMWEAWYDYYSYNYHPYFYDMQYNYDNYWYEWYNYHIWSDYYYGGSFFFDQLHSKKDEWDERVENFRTVFKNESVERRKEIGHQKEDMIVAASFAGRVQNVTHFQNFTSTEYGNCYTMASPKYVAWRSGPTHGVKLTLNLEIDEYVPNFSTGYGIRIVFHEPGTHPLPSHEGITLSPGTETNIGLRMVRISRLSEPHGNCVDGREFSKRYHKKYSISSCYEFCRIHKTVQDCNCVPVEAPDGINLYSANLAVCNSSVKAVKACLLEVDVQFDNGQYSCDCRGPCNETVYAKTMSSTYWPTDDYLEVLISELCEKHKTPYWVSLCSSFQYMPYWELDRFRYNFLRVLIYFEDLNYETITEEPMYESVRFLSDIGGAMGLFLGASVLSFVEVVQVLLELFLLMKEKHFDNKKTRVSHFSGE